MPPPLRLLSSGLTPPPLPSPLRDGIVDDAVMDAEKGGKGGDDDAVKGGGRGDLASSSSGNILAAGPANPPLVGL